MIDSEFAQPIEDKTSKVRLSTQLISLQEDGKYHNNMEDASPENSEQLQKMLEVAGAAGEAKKRFWNMLVGKVYKTGYLPPQDRPTEVLDLACGSCDEANALDEFFGGEEFGSPSQPGRVNLTGIDIKQDDIDRAIRTHARPDYSKQITEYRLPQNYLFIQGDATALDQYPQLPSQADVIVIRHQQISDNEEVWTNIFKQGVNRLSPDGIMLISSFSDLEHQMMLGALKGVGGDLILDEKNHYAKSTSTPEVSIDRNIAIIKRK